MKLMIASDIHGSAYYCEKLLEFANNNWDNPYLTPAKSSCRGLTPLTLSFILVVSTK